MNIVCLDLEGVLVPEIWIAFAENVNIPALKRTTRDEPNYYTLMRSRIEILHQHNFTLNNIQSVIQTLDPLPGADTFLSWLKTQAQIIIVSDTFYEFAQPLMEKLNHPTLFCHHLETGDDGHIKGYTLRQKDPKRKTLQALHQLNFNTIAVGDSYNDLSMLETAHHGIFFRTTPSLQLQYPHIQAVSDHKELRTHIQKLL